MTCFTFCTTLKKLNTLMANLLLVIVRRNLDRPQSMTNAIIHCHYSIAILIQNNAIQTVIRE